MGTIAARRVGTVRKDGFVLSQKLGAEKQPLPRLVGQRRKPQTPLATSAPFFQLKEAVAGR
jgi:hypothetical protein